MPIAIIGWGSLIWRPGDLRFRTRWHADGPRLPIEYARISQDGRLTLVIHVASAEQNTLWVEWDGTDVEAARQALRTRESCALASIHCMCRGGRSYGSILPSVATAVRGWLAAKDMAAAVWTGLESNWQQKRSAHFTADDALSYIRGLQTPTCSDGGLTLDRVREYIEKTPAQIQTEVRRRARAEFHWADAHLADELFEPPPALYSKPTK